MFIEHALKEWSVAVDALAHGQTILLLRKGGIREVGQHFQVPHQRVWLYPTYEHQTSHLLKPDWADQVTAVSAGWHPTQVILKAWADIAYVWTVKDERSVERLLPFHIWNKQFITERFRWKSSQPLHLLLLRVYRLTTPLQIDWRADYGGCRSWLTLDSPLNTESSTPVLDELIWNKTMQKIYTQIDKFEVIKPSQVNELI